MAEFTEVFRHAMRMCDGIPCDKCCLYVDNGCSIRPYNNRHSPAEVEKIVMDWAKENPERQYPTWQEWLREQHIISAGGLYEKAFTPIPDDIAEKLGLTKKEIRNGQN